MKIRRMKQYQHTENTLQETRDGDQITLLILSFRMGARFNYESIYRMPYLAGMHFQGFCRTSSADRLDQHGQDAI